MGGIEHAARGISGVLGERLPWQRKTQRENLALLVATMLSERSANLMALAAALPREPGPIEMRYPWIQRVFVNPADYVCAGCGGGVRAVAGVWWVRPSAPAGGGVGAKGAGRGAARRTGGADPGSE